MADDQHDSNIDFICSSCNITRIFLVVNEMHTLISEICVNRPFCLSLFFPFQYIKRQSQEQIDLWIMYFFMIQPGQLLYIFQPVK